MKVVRAYAKNYFIWYFAALEIIHFILPLNWGDDKVFFQKAGEMHLSAFLKNSSRILIDTLTFFFAKYPWLWRMINPVVLAGLLFLLIRLLKLQTRKQEIVLSALILYPAMALSDAGFMATTLNYLWPFTAGMFVLYFMHTFSVSRFVWLKLPLSIAAALYAASMQQMAAVLLAALAAQLCVSAREKNRKKLITITAHLTVALGMMSVLFYRSFYGTNARFVREAKRYFPDFGALSFFQKTELGFSSTLHGFTSVNQAAVIFLSFCIFLSVMVFRRSNSRTLRAISVFPPVLIISLAALRLFGKNSGIWRLIAPTVNYQTKLAEYRFSPVEDVIFLLTAGAVFLVIFCLAVSAKERITILFVLSLGAGTRLMMGFSPTVWASGYRTFYFLSMALFICGYIILNSQTKKEYEGGSE